MDVLHTGPEDDLRIELGLARLELDAARRARRGKDTPAARQRVVDAMGRIDRLLDRWNDLARTPA
ncbi:hypothetical protein ACI79J_05155 [Geodermatophilus sp. SYSU D01062]